MFRLRRCVVRGAATGLAVALAYGGGVVTGVVGTETSSPGDGGVIVEAADEIAQHAAQPVDRNELEHAAIEGMLGTLDDRWAQYYTPARYRSFRSSLTGRSARGSDRGRREALDTKRGGVAPSEAVTVKPLRDGMLLLDIDEFTKGTGRMVRQAVLADSAPHFGGVILDFRGNPGGLLTEAVNTASVFLDRGTVVSYERGGKGHRVLRATPGGDTSTPLVVLVDRSSASAAEVVAGALRDRGRAVVVGSRTHGKGTVQQTYQLEDGSALKLTVGRYYTASGRSIGKRGIPPDVYIAPDRPSKVAMRRARQVLSALVVTASGESEPGREPQRVAKKRAEPAKGRG